MKCTQCGCENTEGAKFCNECGAVLSVSTSSECVEAVGQGIGNRTKSKKSKKTIMWIAIAGGASVMLALLIMLTAMAVKVLREPLTSDEDPQIMKHRIDAYYLYEENATVFLYDGRLTDHRLAGEIDALHCSAEGTDAIVTDGAGNLYHVTQNKMEKIANNILVSFYLSEDNSFHDGYDYLTADGKTVFYLNKKHSLCKLDLSTLVITPIADDVLTVHAESLPDIGAFSYEALDGELYYCDTDRVISLGENRIVAISQDRTRLCLRNENGRGSSLYLYSMDSEEQKLLTSDLYWFNYGYNSTLTEVFLSENSGKQYFYLEGKGLVPVDDASPYIRILFGNECETFVGELFLGEREGEEALYDLYRLDQNYEPVFLLPLVSRVEKVGDYLYYKDEAKNLCRVKLDMSSEAEKIAMGDMVYVVSPETDTVFYAVRHETRKFTLCCWNPRKGNEIIVENYQYIQQPGGGTSYNFSVADGFLYFRGNDNALYRCSWADDIVKIAEQVYSFGVYPSHVKYLVDNQNIIIETKYNRTSYAHDLYISRDGKDFELILEGIV